jgi:hypothetical protein
MWIPATANASAAPAIRATNAAVAGNGLDMWAFLLAGGVRRPGLTQLQGDLCPCIRSTTEGGSTQRDSTIRINDSENFQRDIATDRRRRTAGHRHVVVNSLGDNGFEIDPLMRDAAAGVSAVT